MFNGKSPPVAAFRFLLLGSALVCAIPDAVQSQTITNSPVSTALYDQFDPRMIPDGAGGAILVWQDYRGGSIDLYAQRVNGAGVSQWPADGVPVCKASGHQVAPRAVSDGAGGVIVVWEDGRVVSHSDIYAQRISGVGVSVWGNGGVLVCGAAGNQKLPTLVPDGQGGAVVAWSDERGADPDIYAQRVNSGGTIQWSVDGVAVCTATGAQQAPGAVPDGFSGVFLVWQDARSGGADIYARRVNASGTPQWTANGEPVCVSAGDQTAPEAISDMAGGVIVSWQDHRGADDDVYVQRLSSAGAPQWTLNGNAVSAASGDQRLPRICLDGSGGAVVTWEDRRGGAADIYAQRVNPAGTPQWAADGVAVCTAINDQSAPAIAFDAPGGAAVVWSDARDAVTGSNVYVQRLQLDGTPLWNPNGALLTNSANVQDTPALIGGDTGGALVAWRDYRNGTYADVYCQEVSATGQVPDQCVPPDSLAADWVYTTVATQNYRTFQQGYFYWGAVGVRGSIGSDWDLEVFDQGGVGQQAYPTCFGLPLAGSYSRANVDFVVGDFTDLQTPPGIYGVRAYLYGGAGSALIEWDGSPQLIQKADNANPNNQVGNTNWVGVLDCYDVDLTAGNTYWFEFMPDPQLDARLMVFSSYGSPGYYYVVSRGDAEFETAGRFYPFTAPSTEPYGVVVTNESGLSGNYTLKVWTIEPVGVGETGVPRATGIRSVSPNPSAGRASIQFALASPGATSFEILDMAGRIVSRLPERTWEAGVWTLEWDGRAADGSRLAAGVYFVQMKVDRQRVGLGRIALVR